MSNNKYDATNHGRRYEEPEREVMYFDPPLVRPGRKKPPLVARVAAGVLMVAVVLGIFAGFVTNYRSGVAYDECIDQIAQTEGFDAAEIAMREGECR